ncbi:BUD13 homolog [Microcaecilia unicolor]|uniref:BUD13 homolog n=1 Tax=Microcaecilia unicolor TaxID=1415580 RepID=A0A6P7ZWK7_9AMPH|nr:BUD13 homolog [Microcaecilia unicolor]
MDALSRKVSGPPLSKAEYLKRYLSGEQTKKRKKRPKPSGKGMRIVDDDDVSWRDQSNREEMVEEEEEDLPVVAEFIDERPEEVKRMEEFQMSNKWKVLKDQNGDRRSSDISLTTTSTVSSENASSKQEENETRHSPDASPPCRLRHDSPKGSLCHDSPDASPTRRPRHDSPDASLPRRQRHDSPDASPPRRQRHDSPDASPPRRQRHDSPDASQPRRQRHDSPDASPPRRQRHDSPDASPPRRPCHDSPDASPPRRPRHDSPNASPPRRLRHDSPDALPPRRPRHDSPDASPPRRPRHDSPNASPPRRPRHDSPDASPPRRPRHDSPDASPPRRPRHDSPDASPPRRPRHDSPDTSPPRKGQCFSDQFPPPKKLKKGLLTDLPSKKISQSMDKMQPSTSSQERGPIPTRKHHSSSDLSPARNSRHDFDVDTPLSYKKQCFSLASGKNQSSTRGKTAFHHHHDLDVTSLSRNSSDSDISPPRNTRRSSPGHSDLSPPRRQQQKSLDSDLSPPRRNQDLGRPPQTQKCSNLSPSRQRTSRWSPQRVQGEGSKVSQMLSGGKAGLVSAKVLKEEQEETRRRERDNKHLEDESQTAKTIFRDKSGRKRDLKQERLDQQQKADKKAERDAQYAKWGKGLVQKEQQEQNLQDAVKEMEKPLARYIHDKDLDQMLREQEREGDPMANFIKKKKAKETTNKKERPRYSGPAPPLNRFNIWPGYRWDGVDRSNGFEQQRFARLANQKAVQEVAYKWSVEDM